MTLQADDVLHLFRGYLCASWDAVQQLRAKLSGEVEPEVALLNWLQASWEILVEANLFHRLDSGRDANGQMFLEVYGEGADELNSGSRVTFDDALATHHITCNRRPDCLPVDILTGQPLDPSDGQIFFDEFVAVVEGWYKRLPPFDHALCIIGDREVVVPVSSISFVVTPIEAGE